VAEKALTQDGVGADGSGNANVWIPLGSYRFQPGDSNCVEVEVPTHVTPLMPTRYGQAQADAVLFATAPLTEGTRAATFAEPWRIRREAAEHQVAVNDFAATTTETLIEWHDNLPEAQSAAALSGRALLIYAYYPLSTFFAHPANHARYYAENCLLRDHRALRALRERYVPVKLNLKERATDAALLGISGAGAAVIKADDRLTSLTRLDGQRLLISTQEFREFLGAN
jgi:hypothetical protein